MKSSFIFLALLLMCKSMGAQQPSEKVEDFTSNFIGDYYLYIAGQQNVNFHSLVFVHQDVIANVFNPGISKTIVVGGGFRLQNNDYLTGEVGRYNINFEFDITRMPGSNYILSGGGTSHISGFRIGYERHFQLFKRLRIIPNIGIQSILIPTERAVSDIWSPYISYYSSNRELNPAFSADLDITYNIYKRYSIFAKARGNYFFVDKQLVKMEFLLDDPINPIKYYQIDMRPYTFNFQIGLKVGLEDRAYYTKK